MHRTGGCKKRATESPPRRHDVTTRAGHPSLSLGSQAQWAERDWVCAPTYEAKMSRTEEMLLLRRMQLNLKAWVSADLLCKTPFLQPLKK